MPDNSGCPDREQRIYRNQHQKMAQLHFHRPRLCWSSAFGFIVFPASLPAARVVDKGQRIVNGLMDVLKLYLTQVF